MVQLPILLAMTLGDNNRAAFLELVETVLDRCIRIFRYVYYSLILSALDLEPHVSCAASVQDHDEPNGASAYLSAKVSSFFSTTVHPPAVHGIRADHHVRTTDHIGKIDSSIG